MRLYKDMMTFIIVLTILFLVDPFALFAQNGKKTDNHTESKEWIKDWVGEKLPLTATTVTPFKTIGPDWDMKRVFLLVGMPDRIGGFGLSILTYNLKDGTQIKIGVADFKNPPIYVAHILKDGSRKQLLNK